jgi:carbamoyltransferase
MLLNTSFNIQEPIVCSPEDAIKTFKSASFDALVIEDHLVKKSGESAE